MKFTVIDGKLHYESQECDLDQIANLLNDLNLDEDNIKFITKKQIQELNRLQVGELVEIIDDGYVYAGYDTWATLHRFENTKLGYSRPLNLTSSHGKIITKGPHLKADVCDILYGLDLNNGMKIIISGSGIDYAKPE
jgi:hypothetical protein